MGIQLQYRCLVPRSPQGARDARTRVTRFAQTWLSAEYLADFEIALGEALANAAEHGGGATITVTCEVRGGALITEIEEHGAGFTWSGPQPPRDGSLRGYGLFMIHALTDELDILEEGRKVRIVKRLGAVYARDVPASDERA
jgi:anti-sigma regulatory factor (Ser/Thr protein kinase)